MFRLTDIPAWTVIAKGGVVFVWFALFFVAERLAPAVQPLAPTGLPRLGRNGAFWLINTLLSPLIGASDDRRGPWRIASMSGRNGGPAGQGLRSMCCCWTS